MSNIYNQHIIQWWKWLFFSLDDFLLKVENVKNGFISAQLKFDDNFFIFDKKKRKHYRWVRSIPCHVSIQFIGTTLKVQKLLRSKAFPFEDKAVLVNFSRRLHGVTYQEKCLHLFGFIGWGRHNYEAHSRKFVFSTIFGIMWSCIVAVNGLRHKKMSLPTYCSTTINVQVTDDIAWRH